jgi:NAD(P)-dependent dehydrogenase (short-subunit alcohol dehydrogenase family)
MSMQMKPLDGVALVTGAGPRQYVSNSIRATTDCHVGSGIGRQICIAFAQAGCRAIALADITIEGMNATISSIKAQGCQVQTLALKTNVTDVVSVRSMVLETTKAFGGIDYGKFFFFQIR